MDQNEQPQENQQPQPELQQTKPGLKKTYILLIVFIVVIGIILGAIISRNNNPVTKPNTQQSATSFPIQILIATPTNTPIPSLRPTDLIVNGKRQYSNKLDMGIAFLYPEKWNLQEDLVDHLITIRNPDNKYQYLSLEKPFDGAGQQEVPLNSENIQVGGFNATLGVYNYCGGSTFAMGKCNKIYGYVYTSIVEHDNWWVFTGPDISTKEGMQDQLDMIKEILSSVRFIK